MLYLIEKNDYFNLLRKGEFNKDNLLSLCVNCYAKNDLTVKDLGYFIFKCFNEFDFRCSINYLRYYDFTSLGLDNDSFHKYCYSDFSNYLCIITSTDGTKVYYVVYFE